MSALKRLFGIVALLVLLAACGDGGSGDNLGADVEPSGNIADEPAESATLDVGSASEADDIFNATATVEPVSTLEAESTEAANDGSLFGDGA